MSSRKIIKRRNTEENSFLQSQKSQENIWRTEPFTVQQKNTTSKPVNLQAQLKRAQARNFDFSKISLRAPKNSTPALQKKVTVGKSDDLYEKAADSAGANFADSLNQTSLQKEDTDNEMMMKPDSLQREEGDDEMMMKPDSLQREEGDEELDMKPDPLQRNEMGDEEEIRGNDLNLDGGEVSQEYETKLNEEKRNGGKNLSPVNQQIVQKHLHSDGSNVKVHTGENASSLCKGVGAKAMTVGNHIMFANASDYSDNLQNAPRDKQELFGHEYEHTGQQGATQQIQSKEDQSSYEN